MFLFFQKSHIRRKNIAIQYAQYELIFIVLDIGLQYIFKWYRFFLSFSFYFESHNIQMKYAFYELKFEAIMNGWDNAMEWVIED